MTVSLGESSDLELKERLSSSGETRISIQEEHRSPTSAIQNKVHSIATFLVFGLFAYIGLTSILHKSPISPFAHENTTSTSHELPDQGLRYGDTVLSVFVFLLTSLASGFLANSLKMPPLLGMLVVGIALRNMGNVSSFLIVGNSAGVVIRKLAFLAILLRGGLGLDAHTLRRMKGACLRLAFLPCTVEAVIVATAAKLILDMDLIFGFVLGFILAAVSPAVVVPGMLAIRDRSLRISTLVIAAASIDDVFAITAFSLVLSVAMNPGEHSAWGIAFTLLRAPIEVLLGVAVGVLGGLILCFVPSPRDPERHFLRVALLLALSSAMMFGSITAGMENAGPISVLVAAFVARFKWKNDLKEGESKTVEEESLARMWDFCLQPLLFTLIGYQLDLSLLGPSFLLSGFLVLVVGLCARLAVAFFAAFSSGLDRKESLYVALAWIPKATVQAALAPVVLDHVDVHPDVESLRGVGTAILTIAVLSILLTAPLGAFLMRFTATRLLQDTNRSE